MRTAAVICPTSQFLCQISAMKAITSSANENAKYILNQSAKGVFFRWSTRFLSQAGALKFARNFDSYRRQDFYPLVSKKVSVITSSRVDQNFPEEGQAATPQTWPRRTFSGSAGQDAEDNIPERPSYERPSYDRSSYETVPRRPVNLEARMRMKAYRREALAQRRAAEIEEQASRVEVDFSKLLQKGAPNTVQGIIREVMTVGFFVTMPKGSKEGFLPGSDLGISGGAVYLERVWKEGQEITVRIVPAEGARYKLTVLPDKDELPDGTRIRPDGTNVGPDGTVVQNN